MCAAAADEKQQLSDCAMLRVWRKRRKKERSETLCPLIGFRKITKPCRYLISLSHTPLSLLNKRMSRRIEGEVIQDRKYGLYIICETTPIHLHPPTWTYVSSLINVSANKWPPRCLLALLNTKRQERARQTEQTKTGQYCSLLTEENWNILCRRVDLK